MCDETHIGVIISQPINLPMQLLYLVAGYLCLYPYFQFVFYNSFSVIVICGFMYFLITFRTAAG